MKKNEAKTLARRKKKEHVLEDAPPANARNVNYYGHFRRSKREQR